jgi:hypothetical protein
MFDLTVVALKFVLLAGLYLFLAYVLVTLSRDVVRAGRRSGAAAPTTGWLIAVTGPGALPGAEFELGDVTSIGRAGDSTIPLSDDFASERHARVRRAAAGFILEDAGSTNGTFLDDRRVGEATLLADGDEVTVGCTVFRFEAGR